ncbi:MAG: hypothetical protein J6M65_11275 [Eubacterium sp.]|nr:hypothetical protein [Eubacterium sp.]
MKKKMIAKMIAIFLVAIIVFTSVTDVEAKTKKIKISSSTLEKGKQFTLVNMPYNGTKSIIKKFKGKKLKISTVQNFAYTPDGKYLFTTSECRTGSTKHTMLCLCKVPDEVDKDAKAECLDAMVLEKYGHGEAIDITQPDESVEEYNLWVATTPYKNKYGKDIARITMSVKDGELAIKKTVKITGFDKANVKNGKPAKFDAGYPLRRLNVAIDEANNQIVFRVQFKSGVNYVAYNFKKINKAIDKLKDKKSYNIQKAAKLQTANLRTNLVPFNSFQSFAVYNNMLYVCGGHFKKGAEIYAIKLKTYKEGKAKLDQKYDMSDVSKVIVIDTKLTIKPEDSEKALTFDKKKLEVEGMKLRKNSRGKLDIFVYFMINGKYTNIKGNKNMGFQNASTAIYKFEVKP